MFMDIVGEISLGRLVPLTPIGWMTFYTAMCIMSNNPHFLSYSYSSGFTSMSKEVSASQVMGFLNE